MLVPANRTFMPRTYKQTAQDAYEFASKYIVANPDTVTTLNISSEKEVTNLAYQIAKQFKPDTPSCYRIAATIAAIFDAVGADYTCVAGYAGKPGQNISSSMPSNHVWIEHDNKIYEMFQNYSGELVHYNVTDTLEFEKGDEVVSV